MADKQEFWTEERLKKGIIWMVVGIVLIAVATFGWWYYLNRPEGGSTPPVLQRQIDDALAKSKKNPNDVGARIVLAQLYLQDKRYDDAIVECNLILKKNKDNEYAYSLMGIAYDEQGNTSSALKNYMKAIDLGKKKANSGLNPAVVEARFRSGKIYLDQNKFDKALLQFQTLADQNKMDADSRYYLGLTFIAQGYYDKAIENLLIATRYVPDYYEAFYNLGLAYEKKGDKDKAIAAYKSALKAKSDYKEAKDALARLEK